MIEICHCRHSLLLDLTRNLHYLINIMITICQLPPAAPLSALGQSSESVQGLGVVTGLVERIRDSDGHCCTIVYHFMSQKSTVEPESERFIRVDALLAYEINKVNFCFSMTKMKARLK